MAGPESSRDSKRIANDSSSVSPGTWFLPENSHKIEWVPKPGHFATKNLLLMAARNCDYLPRFRALMLTAEPIYASWPSAVRRKQATSAFNP